MITEYDEDVLNVGPPPILYWIMDDESGTTVQDYSGNGRHGTLHRSGSDPYPTLGAPGPFSACKPADKAIQFSKNYRHAVINTGGPGWLLETSLSVEAWFNITPNHGPYGTIVQNRRTPKISADPNFIRMSVRPPIVGAQFTSGVETYIYIQDDVYPVVGEWHYLVITSVASTRFTTVYYDGAPVATGSWNGSISNEAFHVGSDVSDWLHPSGVQEEERVDGRIGRVACYEHTLTAADVRRRWNLRCGFARPLLRQRQMAR